MIFREGVEGVAEFGEGRLRIHAVAIAAGNDLVVFLGGGEAPHVGGISLSDPPAPSITISIPGHKDYLVSHEVSERISRATGRRCLVVAGIHVDNASKEDIAALVRNSSTCADLLIRSINGANLPGARPTS
ncbi:MAG: hypothetical protein QFX35_07360 [Candidatus Verstraetearchaeota archaeon]|nr:hypothetical protein [Candidatus Verstraetearchaeota archaeon]